MTITEICVTAGRHLADPNELKTTLVLNVHLKASIEGEKHDLISDCTQRLQKDAERFVEAHRDRLIRSLANRRSIQRVNDAISDAMDGADEQSQEVKRLELSLEQLKLNPSIFNDA